MINLTKTEKWTIEEIYRFIQSLISYCVLSSSNPKRPENKELVGMIPVVKSHIERLTDEEKQILLEMVYSDFKRLGTIPYQSENLTYVLENFGLPVRKKTLG